VLLNEGEPVGSFAMVVRRADFKEQPALRLDLVSRTTAGESIPAVDSSVVYVSRDSLKPLSSFRFIKTGNALTATAANYVGDAVAVSSFSPQGERQRMLPVGARSFDSDEITFLCRALKLPSGRPLTLQIVSPMGPPVGGGVLDGKLGVTGDQQVSVPAGTFDCLKVVMNLGPHIVVVWYEKAGAHRMIRYQAAGSGLTMELVGSGTLPAGL
jgi:hypothetical protein